MNAKRINNESPWQKSNILATLLLLLITACSSFYLGHRSNLISGQQLELTRLNLLRDLIPMLKSDDQSVRLNAYIIAERAAPDIAASLAKNAALYDHSKVVQAVSNQTLKRLSMQAPSELKQQAIEGLRQVSILDELREKRLLKDLQSAHSYVEGGGRKADEKASGTYEKVLRQLSDQALQALDQNLLNKAKQNSNVGDFEQAARIYQSIFSLYTHAES